MSVLQRTTYDVQWWDGVGAIRIIPRALRKNHVAPELFANFPGKPYLAHFGPTGMRCTAKN